MTQLQVNTSRPYRIAVENGSLPRLGAFAQEVFRPGARAMLVGDSNVLPLYGEAARRSLEEAGFSCARFSFPAGEASKQLSTVQALYGALAEHAFTRSDFLVALGGGVTGDLTGFAAATYLRGVGFLQVPTSLLAQIDSSVGGKTGVDLPQGKNLVGAFHQPRFVLIDPQVLSTLPPRFFADGMGEAVKYGCIRDRALFEEIASHPVREDPERLRRMIYRCVDCKREIVERDEYDTGERMLLNFGHTLGHALEKLHGFSGLTHGGAVGVGMVWISRAGERAGLTEPGTAARIAAALERCGLPTGDSAPLPQVLEATRLDKKSRDGVLNLVLLRRIGEAFVHPVPRSEVEAFLEGCNHA